MPYNESTGAGVPDYVPSENKTKWAKTWNASYKEKIDAGESKEKAEEYAFAVANSKWGPKQKKVEDLSMPNIQQLLSQHADLIGKLVKEGSFSEPLLFCRLVKVDQAKREVWGVVTCEEPDRDNEICDFDTTVPFYQALVDEMQKASEVNPDGGVNIFPLRAMHGLVAAGKGISIEFRKDAKEIYMGFKVVDDNEWKKVQENVYTGFSQGGRYVKRWKDGDYMRYTAKPGEVSLVDVPCLQAAHFDAVKVLKSGGYDFIKDDGSTEFRKYSVTKEAGAIPATSGDIPTTPTPVNDADLTGVCTCDCANCKNGSCSTCTAGEKCKCAGKAAKARKCSCKCAMCAKGECKSCSADEKCQMCMSAKAERIEEMKALLSSMTKKEKKKAGVKYLVTDSDGNGYLPYTRGDGKPNHNLMGAAWAALHGGYRGNKYEGPDKAGAIKRLKQVYAREGMETPSEKSARITDLIKSTLEDRINCRAYGYLGKGMYTVGRFASIVEDLGFLWLAIDYERDMEGDESPVVDDVKDILESLLDAVLAYTEEQVEEAKQILSSK